MEIPSGGGDIRVTSAARYEFTPDSSGMWNIYTWDNGRDDPHLTLKDTIGKMIKMDDDGAGDMNARIIAYLESGVTYIILAEFIGTETGNYVLTAEKFTKSGGTIPPGGGEVRVNGAMGFEFSPDSSGNWSIYTTDNGDSDPYVEIYDSYSDLIAYDDDSGGNKNASISEAFEKGMTYYILVGFAYNKPGRCLLVVEPTAEPTVDISEALPGDGGEFQVNGVTTFEFSPAQTGLWEMRTFDNGYTDPILAVYDAYGDMIVEDDDNGGDLNALLFAILLEGETYYIFADFYDDAGSYMLSVRLAEEIPGSGGNVQVDGLTGFMFTPDRAGVWEFRTSNNGDFDPALYIVDFSGNFIAEGDDEDGYNVLINVDLDAGETYAVFVGFYDELGWESCTLTVTRK